MPYLIDSDLIIDHLLDVSETTMLLEFLAKKGAAISIITYMETYQNVLRSRNQQKAKKVFDALINEIPVLPFSIAVARRCAELRELLKREGKRVNNRSLDILNASIAIEYDLTLVTRNNADYKDITVLKLLKP